MSHIEEQLAAVAKEVLDQDLETNPDLKQALEKASLANLLRAAGRLERSSDKELRYN